MKEMIYYLAFDGKKFDEEDDCIQYEWQLKYEKVKNDLKLYKEDYKETKFDYRDAGDLYGIKCSSLEAMNFIVEWFMDYGTELPFNSHDAENEENLGIWYWKIRHYPASWYHLDKELAELNELKSKFE